MAFLVPSLFTLRRNGVPFSELLEEPGKEEVAILHLTLLQVGSDEPDLLNKCAHNGWFVVREVQVDEVHSVQRLATRTVESES